MNFLAFISRKSNIGFSVSGKTQISGENFSKQTTEKQAQSEFDVERDRGDKGVMHKCWWTNKGKH